MFPRSMMQNLRNDRTSLIITTRSDKVLYEPHMMVHLYMDDVTSEGEVIINDGDLNNGPVKSKKLQEVGKKKATIEQPL